MISAARVRVPVLRADEVACIVFPAAGPGDSRGLQIHYGVLY